MSIRTKLKETQIRLSELAHYLNVSRPTLYRYLELYENKEYNEIDKKSFDLFSFIENSKKLKRHSVMDYLINKIIPIDVSQESDFSTISNVRKLAESQSDEDKKKLQIIKTLSSTNKFDNIVDYLFELSNIETEEILKQIEKGEKNGRKKIENN